MHHLIRLFHYSVRTKNADAYLAFTNGLHMRVLERFWAKLGLVLAAAILASLPPGWMHDGTSLLWLLAAALLLHQFEEYVLPGGFRDFYNQAIRPRNALTRRALSPAGVLLVNVAVAWPAYGMAALLGGGVPWVAAGMALITLLNGLLHTGLLLAKRTYNPGAVSSIFLLIPVSMVLLSYAAPSATASEWVAAIALFFAGSAMVPVIIHLTGKMA